MKARELMHASKAPSTWKKYTAEFDKFRDWASERGLSYLPATSKTVLRYLAFRAEKRTSAVLSTTSAAISAFHKMEGLPSPSADSRVAALLEGARRTFSKPVHQKALLTTSIIRRLWKRETGKSTDRGNILQWRGCWLITLMFRTCARFADVCKLKRSNFTFKQGALEVFFQFRKNDQRGKGHTVKILQA